MLLVLDGPEAAGKTTIAQAVAEGVRPRGWHVVHVRCRYPVPLNPAFYAEMVRLGKRADVLVIMDRSWASEVVYSGLLNRELSEAAHEYEWQLGRAVSTIGAKLMVLANPLVLAQRRQQRPAGLDHPLDPVAEHDAFLAYAEDWGWPIARLDDQVPALLRTIDQAHLRCELFDPHVICGSPHARVAIIGERHGPGKLRPPLALDIAPLGGYGTRWLQHVVPRPYDQFVWTNADAYASSPLVRGVIVDCPVAIVMGNAAQRILDDVEPRERYVGQVIRTPHPAAAVRWGSLRASWPLDRWRQTFAAALDLAEEAGSTDRSLLGE